MLRIKKAYSSTACFVELCLFARKYTKVAVQKTIVLQKRRRIPGGSADAKNKTNIPYVAAVPTQTLVFRCIFRRSS